MASAKLPISQAGHDMLVADVKKLIEKQAKFTTFLDKMKTMDAAYASYVKESIKTAAEDKDTPIETPLIVSQVDTVVGYLAEVYLSGYPTFGIVAEGDARAIGDQMEALIDSFANKSEWTKHILRHFVDGAKYNVNALESAWEPRRLLDVAVNDDPTTSDKPKVGFSLEYVNKLICPDMYNTFWDYRYTPTEVADRGDYIGYNEIMSKLELKRLALILNEQGIGMNNKEAFASKITGMENLYVERPIISEYIVDKKAMNWAEWALGYDANARKGTDYSDAYMVTKLYMRLIPADYGIISPTPAEPEIWKLRVVNAKVILGMERIYSPNDSLPIRMGQYNDDGFGYQTRSVAEGILPWQDVASELINIRLNAARRALSDRAVYDPSFVSADDVNSSLPAAKIPLKKSLRNKEKSIDQVYRAIPFDGTGIASTSQDLQTVIQMAEYVHGFNSASQGSFRKGNRTLGEFEGVQSGSDNRSRLIAIREESSIFTPIKQSIKLNILQFQPKQDLLSLTSGEQLAINPEDLRKTLLEFKVADGFTPKSKIMSTEAATIAFQTLQAMPLLAQKFRIEGVFADLMSAMGYKGLDKHIRTEQEQVEAPVIDPETGLPVGEPENGNTNV